MEHADRLDRLHPVRRRGRVARAPQSWIRSAPREFAFLALVSIPLWLVFELYNRLIENWHYVGLPEDPGLRYFGYAWSFATIWPAIFEGAELVGVWRAQLRPGTTWTVERVYASPARAAFLTQALDRGRRGAC